MLRTLSKRILMNTYRRVITFTWFSYLSRHRLMVKLRKIIVTIVLAEKLHENVKKCGFVKRA